jgi:hypothetical protein
LHGPPGRRRQPGNRRLWREAGGSEEVGNPMGVGVGRKSDSQVRPDRNPEVPRGQAPHRLRAVGRAGGASTRGEGASPTVEQEDPGGEEGQESIGPDTGLTAGGRERTLGWSKALKPPAPARPRWLRDGLANPVAPFGRLAHQPRGRPTASPSLSPASAGGRRVDAEGSPGARGGQRRTRSGSTAGNGTSEGGGKGRDEVTRDGRS